MARPDQLQPAVADKAEFVICDQSIEQDHRAIKRIVRPMMGFKSFRSARTTLQGVELMHMIKKGQMISGGNQGLSAAGHFYSLAA